MGFLFWTRLRNYLITGLIVILPVFVTAWVLLAIFRFWDGLAGRYLGEVLADYHMPAIPGLGVLLTLILLLIVGMLSTNMIGRRLIAWTDTFFARVPVARTLYTSTKQMVDAVIRPDQRAFQQVVLVEYPRRGVYSVGFITGEVPQDKITGLPSDMVEVFVPSTPNPTTGWFLMVPRDDIIMVDMSVEDGMKLIVSAGVLGPNGRNHSQGRPTGGQ